LWCLERRRLSQQQVQQPSGKSTPAVATNGSVAKSTAVRSTTITNTLTMKKGKKDKNKKITKADIGIPSDFKHISHVGWDPNQGFALDNVDPNLLKFFAKVRQLFDLMSSSTFLV
jgi:Wiskott-Aldrich syndrome protein